MRIWIVWAVLAVIWALQAGMAALVHHTRPAVIMAALAGFFALVGSIVRRRTADRETGRVGRESGRGGRGTGRNSGRRVTKR